MPIFQVLNQDGLIEFAHKRGWVQGEHVPERRIEDIPPVEYLSFGKRGRLPEVRYETRESVHIRIPEVLIHGGNFSLIVEDKIFPGGFAHSFLTSKAWRPVGNGLVSFEPGVLRQIEASSPALLGLVSHWGHFFVDALDRLLKLEDIGLLDSRLLVGDPDFFGLKPKLDERHAVPQVTELMHLLGINLDPAKFIPLYKQFDYRAINLNVCTLASIKPAMSSNTYRQVRQRVLGKNVGFSEDGGKTVFVGRADIKKRYILKQQALVDHLERVHKAETIYPEFMTQAQAVQTFSAADRIILPVGSAKFNLSFCRPGTKVVCVMPKGYSAQNGGIVGMVRHLCNALDLKLVFYDVEIEKRNILVNSNLIVSVTDIDNMVAEFDRLS